MNENLLTVEDVAARVSMSQAWVLRRIAVWTKDRSDPRGLPAINLSGVEGRGARWRVSPAVLDEWLKDRVAA